MSGEKRTIDASTNEESQPDRKRPALARYFTIFPFFNSSRTIYLNYTLSFLFM